MSAPDAFQPVTRTVPCVICGKGDWCRRTQDGAHECHRINEPTANGYVRIAKTPKGYTVYRHPQERRAARHGTMPAKTKCPRIFDSPDGAARSFAEYRGGTIEKVYRWSATWYRARIHVSDGKAFCEITRNGSGWVLRGPAMPRPLYRVGELPIGGIVVICEGEKACDAGWSINLPCVTSGAADSASSADWTSLRGREIVILPDHDEPGARYAVEVARQLKALDSAVSVKIVELPGLGEGEDLHDFINEHRDSRESDEIKAEIMALISSAKEFRVTGEPNTPATDWPEPQRLPDVLPSVRTFVPSLLPESLRGWIEDIAERVQCPIDYPAVGAMVALAAVVGRKVGICPKQKDNWLVVPNLWGAIIGRPGVMKSPALAEVLKPLKRLEVEAKDEYERAARDFATARMVDEIRHKVKKGEIEKAVKRGGDANAIAQELIADDARAPARKRLIINDSTVEKLGVLLIDNPNGVVCYRDELVGLLTSLDREEQEGARAFYLEAWNGTGRFTYDRIGRGTLDIEACCVSILGGIQPGPLANYLRSAVHGGKGDDGLLQRFQLAVWPEPSRAWRNVDRWPNAAARDQAYSVYRKLDTLNVAALDAKRDGFDVEGIPYLRLASGAQERFDHWRALLEGKVRSGEDHPAIEAHLAKFRSLVPSLALLIHLAEEGVGAVTDAAMERAIGRALYLESHARRLYATVSCAETMAALKLAEKLRAKSLKDGFALRDVYRPAWTGLTSRDEALAAVRVLTDHDWLIATKEITDGAPRTRYWVNPRIYATPGNGTDKTDKSPPS